MPMCRYEHMFSDIAGQNSVFYQMTKLSIEMTLQNLNKNKLTDRTTIAVYHYVYGMVMLIWGVIRGDLPFDLDESVEVCLAQIPSSV